jgi:DNA-binding GntR family transcriptional regulator
MQQIENDKIPLTQEAYQRIKKKIINLQFRPGEILLVQQLVKMLELSRTPIREALVKLSHEGLVEGTDGRKFKVCEVNTTTIRNIYEIREALETLAIRKALPSMGTKDIDYLEGIISSMVKALSSNDTETFFQLDMDFHQYFVIKSHNQLMQSIMRQIYDHQQRIRYLTTYIDKRMENTIFEHKDIVKALRERDEAGVISATLIHLNNVQNGFVETIRTGKVKFV